MLSHGESSSSVIISILKLLYIPTIKVEILIMHEEFLGQLQLESKHSRHTGGEIGLLVI